MIDILDGAASSIVPAPASDRLKYGVLGDSVNLSARLSRLNSRYGTSLLVSDDVLQEPTVEDTFLVRLIDKVAVKGRTHATKISEVMAVKKEASEELTTFVAQHNRGMDLYFDRQFNDAIKTFENAMEIYGQKDRALQLLCEKCRKFIENPPPVGWDGTDVLKAKHF
jgi:adenylate cyclase